MSNSTHKPLLVGGIPIVWLVVLSCVLIVIAVCALTYPIILLNRWRMKEKLRAEDDELDEDEGDYTPEPKRKRKSHGGGMGAIFGKGRPSTRGKWVERIDPQSGQPYYEHTGTGEVTWTDPRPPKQKAKGRVGNGNLVVSSMVQQPIMGGGAPGLPMGYAGAPGGFGPRPGMVPHGSMGNMLHTNSMGNMMPHAASMGNVLPPHMQNQMANVPRGMPTQPFPGGPLGAPGVPGGPIGNAPPGMMSAGSMRRTQAAPAPPAAAPAPVPQPAAPAPPAADPKFEKYARMQKAGLPEGAIRNAMNRDGISEAEQKTFLGS